MGLAEWGGVLPGEWTGPGGGAWGMRQGSQIKTRHYYMGSGIGEQ